MDSIFYDVKADPLQHLKAFVQLNTILARQKMRFVQALPLRRSWVYAHVPLNTTILVRCIFDKPYKRTPGGKNIKVDIRRYWGCAVDLEQDMFRSQKGHQFLGFAMMDGVSISVVRETKEEPTETSTKRAHEEPQQQEQEQPAAQQARLLAQQQQPQPLVQQPPPQTQPVRQRQKQADCTYISELTQEQLQSTAGRCMLVDPGRRDLLYMLHEKSTIEEKCVYRYTRCQQRRETKQARYRKILQDEKKADKADIAALGRTLSAGSFIKPDLALFEEYLAARADVEAELTDFYNETTCRQRVGATTPMVPLHRKLR
ncbi:hypothetical protein GGH96_000707, partial [Coemansia sp. RSA 1972]